MKLPLKLFFPCFASLLLALPVCSLLGATEYHFDPGSLIEEAKRSYALVSDYTCLLSKKELVHGTYFEEKNILVKFRKPASFYLKFGEGNSSGTELIFVAGKNDNKSIAHKGGLLQAIVVHLDPYGKTAMKNNRHPVLDAHLGNIITIIDKNYNLARERNVGSFELLGEKNINTRKTICVKATFPKDPRFYGGTNFIYIDSEYHFPTSVEIYGWNGELLEKYEYTNLVLNPGLQDIDFDPKNKNYDF